MYVYTQFKLMYICICVCMEHYHRGSGEAYESLPLHTDPVFETEPVPEAGWSGRQGTMAVEQRARPEKAKATEAEAAERHLAWPLGDVLSLISEGLESYSPSHSGLRLQDLGRPEMTAYGSSLMFSSW